ncbi:hypothetical protein K440DRAFT_620077 [Wilcoxina mikolae CBS 423.85]|nr:hypothetical protein K440DRAFT_620077 [Wilcoxina mikolae CBS 423.85]
MATVVLSRSTGTPPPSLGLHGPQPAMPMSTPVLPVPGTDIERTTPMHIPNKHMQSSDLNGVMFASPVTPPASPPMNMTLVTDVNNRMESLLHPPEDYVGLCNSPPIYAIDAQGLAAAVSFTSRQPLPDIDQLFPWAHGLHPDNSLQLSFFYARKKSARRTPTCYRGICIVRVGRDFTKSRLKGSIIPEEILPPNPQTPGFLCVDPREGFGVRNFHIQVGKFTGLSDIVVYGDDDTDFSEVMRVAKRISAAQIHYRAQCQVGSGRGFPKYSTFVVESAFSVFENLFPEMVTVDSKGNLTGNVVEFCHWERMEMCSMSKASEISNNVWLGSTADIRQNNDSKEHKWGVLIEACDLAQMPSPETLRELLEEVDQSKSQLFLEFPGSGSISKSNWSRHEVCAVVDTCRWIHAVANGEFSEGKYDTDGDHRMPAAPREPRKILIHCTDGYTETSLLSLAYLMFAEVLPVHDAWIKLHTEKNRNFFAYDKDLAFLRYVEGTLLDAGAQNRGQNSVRPKTGPPAWLYRMDGSLPSRVLSYMYLGNLLHANNCGLLHALGIKRVLSIGEEVTWSNEEIIAFGKDKMMTVRDLQDNGCDPLEYQFRHCLEFIDDGRRLNEPILVHCRVGVSRSATICIAEVMRSLRLSLPRAYCFVRARRLNVIIQPHLRFMYELLKFEESLALKSECTPRRELEWIHVAREIAALNRPYARHS